MNNEVLQVVKETEILGKQIKMYGSIENPYFVASDVAEWLGERDGYTVSRKVSDEEKDTQIVCTLGGNQLSRKKIARPLKSEIKKYLKSIRLTGAAIPEGREQEMVNYYFSSLSSDLQGQIVNELIEKNKELQQFYDDLMNTEGLMQINTVAKELGIGEYTLFAYLRGKKVFFYDKDKVNVPYERFRKEGKFVVKETPCHDGNIRAVTYATKKGLEYIRKILRKDGYYNAEVTV